MPKFNPPESFDFTNPSQWLEWKQRFGRFRTATKLKEEDGVVQVSSLIYAMEREAEHIYNAFTFKEDDHKDECQNHPWHLNWKSSLALVL